MGDEHCSHFINDDHGETFLRSQLMADHPNWLLGGPICSFGLDFTHDEVRDYVSPHRSHQPL
jgi:hypothetical protein